MKNKFKIYFPLYDYTLYVEYVDDMYESAVKVNKRAYKDFDFSKENTECVDALHVIVYNDAASYILLKSTATYGTIAHEAIHAVHHLFDWIGVRKIDEELLAYHVGYIVDEIQKHLSK